jgi:5'(3')-deoxyribonucleotidase
VRILCDVDGILADMAGKYIRLLNHQTGRRHTVEDVTEWHFERCVASSEENAAVWREMNEINACYTISPYPDAKDFLASLRTRGEVVAVTTPASTHRWCFERTQWLLNHGFALTEIVFTHNKALVRGDVLIDDHPDNIQAFADAGGVGILLERPWNRKHVFAQTPNMGPAPVYAADYEAVLVAIDRYV